MLYLLIGSLSADESDVYTPLIGHSLSWTDERRRSSTGTVGLHTMSAKIWIPEAPRHANSVSLASYAAIEHDWVADADTDNIGLHSTWWRGFKLRLKLSRGLTWLHFWHSLIDISNEKPDYAPACSFYPRDAMLALVFARATCLSVRLTICPSCHTPVLCQNEESVMISSPSGSPTILVFWTKFHPDIGGSPERGVHPSGGFPRAGASNKGGLEKFGHFLALSINISKTILWSKILMTNRKSHMDFLLTPRSMTLDYLAIRSNFIEISRGFAILEGNDG